MLTGNELFVIAKMVSGENVMACLNAEDDYYVELEYPILIRMMPTPLPNREAIAATPYCQFSGDTKFLISKRNIMFIKKLHPSFVPHFMRFASEYEETAFVAKEQTKHQMEAFGEEEMTLEEIQRRIDMLESIAGGDESEIPEEKNFIDGNDTIH